ncbi:hypothetical protein [Planktothrix phage Pra-JY27]|nr:HCP-like protein [Planktothrix phage Pag-Yong1]WEV89199.1 hypothetical protein [Synechococcus phage MinM2]
MTLPASGSLSLAQINSEFGRGLNLDAYRGVPWWTDAGASGAFAASGNLGFADFYGKRATPPPSTPTPPVPDSTIASFTQTLRYDTAFVDGFALYAQWIGRVDFGGLSLRIIENFGNRAGIAFSVGSGRPGNSAQLIIGGIFNATTTQWEPAQSAYIFPSNTLSASFADGLLETTVIIRA